MFAIKNITLPSTHSKKILLLNKSFSRAPSIVENPIVSVTQGKLKGLKEKLLNGSPYYSFKGIPYGEPPIGELRFKASTPVKPWSGIKDALKHGAVCTQYDIYTASLIDGSECLFLNIYTPSLESTSKLPVMVFVHGGAFISGSGNSDMYGPEYLCEHDVILVTLNYRLESLGFLCLDTPEVPGNAGMKDQVLALKWVQENIEKFGGDPNNVILFGESAGAASAMYHMFSPMSQGLFHKAISQSGTCINDWALGNKSKERAFRIGKLLGKETSDSKELLDYFRSLPSVRLVDNTLPTRTDDEKFRGLPVHIAPTIEKVFNNVEHFLTDDPINLLMEKKVAKIPFMIGYNSGEGIITLADQLKKAAVLNKQPHFMLPREIANKLSDGEKSKMGAALKKFYLGDKDLSKDTIQEIVDMQTDRHFAYNCHRFARIYSAFNKFTYVYKFDLETDLNLSKKMLGYEDLRGVNHTDELFYLFSNKFTKKMYKDKGEVRDAVQKVTKLWTDFAKTGNPIPNSSHVQWKPYTPNDAEYLLIGEELTPSSHADRDRVAFWDSMYEQAGLPVAMPPL